MNQTFIKFNDVTFITKRYNNQPFSLKYIILNTKIIQTIYQEQEKNLVTVILDNDDCVIIKEDIDDVFARLQILEEEQQ